MDKIVDDMIEMRKDRLAMLASGIPSNMEAYRVLVAEIKLLDFFVERLKKIFEEDDQ